MALYAIGDLHLSMSSGKPMDVFGSGWAGHANKLTEGFSVLTGNDVCVLCGDISWGMSLEESLEDFRFIDNLPGIKIVLKGNHDYWWSTVSKMRRFFAANGIKSIDILHNNCFFYGNTAICGTRGWMKDETLSAAINKKAQAREVIRLETSLQAAAAGRKAETENDAITEGTASGNKNSADGSNGIEKICFFHYPPRFGNIANTELITLMEKYGVKRCYYGHLHGTAHNMAVRGDTGGIDYDIISADFLRFKPQRIL